MTSRPVQAITVGDGALVRELEAALSGAGRGRDFLRAADTLDDAERLLRQRSADLIVLELGTSAEALRRFAAAARTLAPEVLLVAVENPVSDEPTSPGVLAEAVRSRLDDLLERPLSSDALRAIIQRLAERRTETAARAGSVLTFHSTKGGVGKSTLSINTAVGLALRHPDRVLLIDGSLQLGVCASALDVSPRHSLATAAREHDRLDPRMLRDLSSLHEPSGLRLLSAPADAIEASDVDDAAMARVISIARREFRFVIVDTLPIVDAVMLGVFDLADRIHLVNQGTVPDVIGAARLTALLDRLEIPRSRTRVVLNRTMAPFPGQLERADVAERIGRPVDFEVPYERRVLSALNLGEPYVMAAGRRGWGAVIAAIVDDADDLQGAQIGAVERANEEPDTATPVDTFALAGIRSAPPVGSRDRESHEAAPDPLLPLDTEGRRTSDRQGGWRRRLLRFAMGGGRS